MARFLTETSPASWWWLGKPASWWLGKPWRYCSTICVSWGVIVTSLSKAISSWPSPTIPPCFFDTLIFYSSAWTVNRGVKDTPSSANYKCTFFQSLPWSRIILFQAGHLSLVEWHHFLHNSGNLLQSSTLCSSLKLPLNPPNLLSDCMYQIEQAVDQLCHFWSVRIR